METIPIKTRIMNAFRPKDEPSGVCPDCQDGSDEKATPREAVVEWLKGLGHTEDEAREIEQRMADVVREEFPLPPEDEDDREPQKDT